MLNCLSDLKLGEKAKIVSLDITSAADRQKLFACGLIPGVEVSIERIAPLGDPIQIRLDGDVLLSIRKTEGCYVKVHSLSR
jgi:Fe2+ transport system protein FeoA